MTKKKFIEFYPDFNECDHTIQLADSSKITGIVKGKGLAKIHLVSSTGEQRDVTLEALYIPSYDQNLLSVPKINQKGVSVHFDPNSARILTPDGTYFKIETRDRLYYVNSVRSQGPKGRTA